jgi:hypothetical protein
MENFFRPIAIIIEVVILMAVIYSLLLGVKFIALDFGLEEKYKGFIYWVFMILGCIALVFFIAHLMTFYPRLSI